MNFVRKKELKLALAAMPFSPYKKEQRLQSPVGPFINSKDIQRH